MEGTAGGSDPPDRKEKEDEPVPGGSRDSDGKRKSASDAKQKSSAEKKKKVSY